MLHTLTSSVKNDGKHKTLRYQGDRVVKLTKLAALIPFAKSESSPFNTSLPTIPFLLITIISLFSIHKRQVFEEELTPVSPRQSFDK